MTSYSNNTKMNEMAIYIIYDGYGNLNNRIGMTEDPHRAIQFMMNDIEERSKQKFSTDEHSAIKFGFKDFVTNVSRCNHEWSIFMPICTDRRNYKKLDKAQETIKNNQSLYNIAKQYHIERVYLNTDLGMEKVANINNRDWS